MCIVLKTLEIKVRGRGTANTTRSGGIVCHYISLRNLLAQWRQPCGAPMHPIIATLSVWIADDTFPLERPSRCSGAKPMKLNCQRIARQLCSVSMILAGAAFLSIPSAKAQMSPSGTPSQTSPSQTSPASQRGMSPMNQAMNNQGQSGSKAQMDKAFVKKAMQGGMAEVQLGQLAADKGSSDDVKQFGQKMVDDHSKLNDQMKQVAEQMNVTPPTSLSAKDKATMTKLQALNGDAFDKAYIKDMIKDHKKDESEFKHEAQSASNPALKEAATQGAQVIGEHLQMIQQIAQKNNVASK